MSQFQDHPFVTLMNTLFPVILPQFHLRSVRDRESMPEKYPLVDYVIIRGGREVLERPKNTFRSEIDVQIDILVQESSPLSWCEYDFLKDAQTRQALFSFLHNRLRQFIKLVVNPTLIDPSLVKACDVIFEKHDWRFVQTIGTEYFNQKTADNLTGVSAVMQFSYIPREDSVCCLSDGTEEQYQNMQGMVLEDSTSYKLIQNKIDAI